jgi:hypothetical protein
MRLSSINNPTELLLLSLSQINIPRCPVLLQPLHLGSTRDSNHTLSGNPGKRDLTDRTALANSELLDFLDDCLVFVEIVALEFGGCEGGRDVSIPPSPINLVLNTVMKVGSLTCATEIIRGKVIGRLVVEVIHKPPVSERAVCNVGDAQLLGCFD